MMIWEILMEPAYCKKNVYIIFIFAPRSPRLLVISGVSDDHHMSRMNECYNR